MATTTVIIPLRDNGTSLDTCLDAVRANRSAGEDLEVVMVGDALPSGLSPSPANERFRLRLVPQPTPQTFAQACNAGARATSGEYVILLEPATTAQPGWLDVLIDYATGHPEAAVIGSKLVDANAKVCHAGVVIGQDRYPRPLYAGFPPDHTVVNKTRRFQIVNLEGALIRRRAFELSGGFDTDFSGGFEDVDLCLRLADLGYETHYCHRSLLFQANRRSKRWGIATEESSGPYRRRWARRVSPDDLRYLIEDGLLSVSYAPSHEMSVAVSPFLGANDQAPQGYSDSRLQAVPSRSLIELMTRTIDLTRQVQGIERQLIERFDELSARIRHSPGRFPDLESHISNGDCKSVNGLEAQSHWSTIGEDAFGGHGDNVEDAGTGTSPHPVSPESPMGTLDGWERPRTKRTTYRQIIRRIRDVVNARLPLLATVIVVSKGDEKLLELGPRRGWHFPQNEAGVYAGYYPADSRDAIAQLEKLRRGGGEFLLFPSTSFWWLGYYSDFQKYLESRYPCVWSDRSCLIFQLTTHSNGRDCGT
jgi:GT2 family glycosyltransferase